MNIYTMEHIRKFNEGTEEDIIQRALDYFEPLHDEGFTYNGTHIPLGSYGAESNAWTKLFMELVFVKGEDEDSFKNLKDCIEWQKQLSSSIDIMILDNKLDIHRMGRVAVNITTQGIRFQIEFTHNNRHIN